MFKVSMAVSLLLVSAAASAHSGLQIEAGQGAQASQHSMVRFDQAQTVAFAGKKPAAKAEEPKAAAPAKEEAVDPATYKPKTAHDNTPYRFNMNQNGKKMTADEFDAWMKSRGVRVAKGAPAAGAAAAPAGQVASESKGK